MPDQNGIFLTPESQKILDGLVASGDIDLRPTLAVIGIGYRKEVALIFNHQQPRESGLRWPELSPAYAKQKERKYPGTPILVRSGALIESMTQDGAPGNINIITRFGATFGSYISYGIYHDSDAPRKSNLPQRNFSEPSEAREVIWQTQIREALIHNFEVNGVQVDGDIFQNDD